MGTFNIQLNISLFGPCPTSTSLERWDEYWNCIAQPGKLDSKIVWNKWTQNIDKWFPSLDKETPDMREDYKIA